MKIIKDIFYVTFLFALLIMVSKFLVSWVDCFFSVFMLGVHK